MEILRFDESDVPAPKRKSASKGWLALGLVATLMGVGTAFASSTINVNGNNLASLGQGVSVVTGCDDNITVSPVSGLDITDESPSFKLSSIQLGDIDLRLRITDTGADFGHGCAGQALKIQVFQMIDDGEDPSKPKPISCSSLVDDLAFDGADGNATLLDYKESADSSGCEIWAQLENPGSHPTDGSFTISGLKFPQVEHHAISHITVVSSESYPTTGF